MISLIKTQVSSSIASAIGKTSFAALPFLFVACFASMASIARADVVTDWNQIADTAVVTNAKRPAAAALVDMAYVHAAIYDAVNAIDRRYTVYAVSPAGVPSGDTSKEAAAATAAYKVLLALFPNQESFLNAKIMQYLAAINEGQAKAEGIALGEEIAAKLILLRAGDGRNAAVPFTPWTGPGNWLPTPPAFSPTPLTPWMATMRPFMIESPSQFRAEGPPALHSPQWANDYKETKLFGSSNNSLRTPEQTEIGLFYTEHTGAQLSRSFRNFALSRNLSVAADARLFAMMYLSIADSLIAGWDSKYYFHFWRPVTAIRAGETDDNGLTEADSAWTPLTATPGHPEYPAAHGCLTGAYAEALRAFYGTKKVNVTLSSAVTNTTRTFDNTDDLIKEITEARVFGGMHYRTSVMHGVAIGKKVARWMNRFYFHLVE